MKYIESTAKHYFVTSVNTQQKKSLKETLLSHLHPQFHHILQLHTYIHTLKLTRWLPRHTTRRLSFYYSTRHV
jgi:hypothetical protein